MVRRHSATRRGLTLIELVVVLAILAALTMILIPKLDGLQNQANHAAAASSVADTAKYIQTYNAKKSSMWYPDGWDSLTTNGTALWTLADPTTNPPTKGLHPTAFAANGKFTTDTLSADDVASLNLVGIKNFLHVTTTLSARPGDMFTTEAAIAEDNVVAVPNPATSGGRKIIDHVYRANLKTGGTSGALPSGKKLIALGFGPMNKLIGTLALECPVYANVDSTVVYNRNLALFEVGGSNARAIFRGVVAADGDLQDDLTTYINRDL